MSLLRLIHEHHWQVGAEIGVWRGAHAFALLEGSPGLTRLYLIDPWRWDLVCFPVPLETPLPQRMNPGTYCATMGEGIGGQDDMEDIAASVVRQAQWFEGRAVVWRATSARAAMMMAERLDFVYIDATHLYEDVAADLRAWWPHIRPGGGLTGDDWGQEFPGVPEAVMDWCEETGQDGPMIEAGGFWWIIKH